MSEPFRPGALPRTSRRRRLGRRSGRTRPGSCLHPPVQPSGLGRSREGVRSRVPRPGGVDVESSERSVRRHAPASTVGPGSRSGSVRISAVNAKSGRCCRSSRNRPWPGASRRFDGTEALTRSPRVRNVLSDETSSGASSPACATVERVVGSACSSPSVRCRRTTASESTRICKPRANHSTHLKASLGFSGGACPLASGTTAEPLRRRAFCDAPQADGTMPGPSQIRSPHQPPTLTAACVAASSPTNRGVRPQLSPTPVRRTRWSARRLPTREQPSAAAATVDRITTRALAL